MQWLYFYSCNTSSIVKHPGRWMLQTYWIDIQLIRGAFQMGSIKSRIRRWYQCNWEARRVLRETTLNDVPGHCYCNEYCQACTSGLPANCMVVSSVTNATIDFTLVALAKINGNPSNRCMESKMCPDFKKSLGSSLSQEDGLPSLVLHPMLGK